MKRRVVITGLGAATLIGNTVEEFWKRRPQEPMESNDYEI